MFIGTRLLTTVTEMTGKGAFRTLQNPIIIDDATDLKAIDDNYSKDFVTI